MTQAQKAATIVETSRVRVELAPGRTKQVTVPVDGGPVPMGLHGGVAEHYKAPPDEYVPHATTLDYIVGAAAGCLTGTFGAMLAALGQPNVDGGLVTLAEGDIVNDGGVLRIHAIRVTYRVRLAPGVSASKIQQAHDRHHRFCPVARSIGGCIDISTELELT